MFHRHGEVADLSRGSSFGEVYVASGLKRIMCIAVRTRSALMRTGYSVSLMRSYEVPAELACWPQQKHAPIQPRGLSCVGKRMPRSKGFS